MTWTFRAKAKDERRLGSRVFHLLEQQMVSVRLFHAKVNEGKVQITFVIASEEDKTCRITNLLHRLQGVTVLSINKTQQQRRPPSKPTYRGNANSNERIMELRALINPRCVRDTQQWPQVPRLH